MSKIVNGVASEYEIPMKHENNKISEEEWLSNHKDEIKNINNMVDELEKNKKVQKLVETFSKWQDPTIEKLQQENQQLKLDYELYKDNHIYKNYEVETKDNTIKQLKEVIEEVREYVKNNDNFELADLYSQPIADEIQNKLLQILDKAKGGD